MKNIWWKTAKGAITTNPYHETAFKVISMRRDIVLPDQVTQYIEQRRQLVRTMPGTVKVAGRELTQPDITAASLILRDSNQRMQEELLEHQPEPFPDEELDRLEARLPTPDWPQQPPRPASMSCLTRAVQEFAGLFADDLPPVPVPPHPVNTDPIPPFGRAHDTE